MFEKYDSSTRKKLMVASFSILVFVLTQENAFSQRVHFKAKRKSIGSFKLGILEIALHLRDWHAFM